MSSRHRLRPGSKKGAEVSNRRKADLGQVAFEEGLSGEVAALKAHFHGARVHLAAGGHPHAPAAQQLPTTQRLSLHISSPTFPEAEVEDSPG